jgi:hypothetical protein
MLKRERYQTHLEMTKKARDLHPELYRIDLPSSSQSSQRKVEAVNAAEGVQVDVDAAMDSMSRQLSSAHRDVAIKDGIIAHLQAENSKLREQLERVATDTGTEEDAA